MLAYASSIQVLPGPDAWMLVQMTPSSDFFAEIAGINRLSVALLMLVLVGAKLMAH